VFAQGRSREAVAALRKAVALSPSYAAARYNLASVLSHQENSEEALLEAEHARRLGSADRAVNVVSARALIQLDRFEEAERLLNGLLVGNPDDTQSHGMLIQLRQVRGDEDPLRDLRTAATRTGAPPAVRLALADALRRRGDYASAADHLEKLVAELGRLPQLLSSLATIQQECGRMEEAFLLARDALAALPKISWPLQSQSGKPPQRCPWSSAFARRDRAINAGLPTVLTSLDCRTITPVMTGSIQAS
jgi:tetratricopeptide (TPR) repeat protein